MLRAVATDGHRLALCETTAASAKAKTSQQVIVRRKGVLELQRVLTEDGDAELAIGTKHVRALLTLLKIFKVWNQSTLHDFLHRFALLFCE